MSQMLLQLSLCVVTMVTMASSANVLLDYNLCLRIEQMLNTLRSSNAQLLRDVAQIMNELEDVKDQIGLSDTVGEFKKQQKYRPYISLCIIIMTAIGYPGIRQAIYYIGIIFTTRCADIPLK